MAQANAADRAAAEAKVAATLARLRDAEDLARQQAEDIVEEGG
jgi:hypothetical protein